MRAKVRILSVQKSINKEFFRKGLLEQGWAGYFLVHPEKYLFQFEWQKLANNILSCRVKEEYRRKNEPHRYIGFHIAFIICQLI